MQGAKSDGPGGEKDLLIYNHWSYTQYQYILSHPAEIIKKWTGFDLLIFEKISLLQIYPGYRIKPRVVMI